MANKGAFTKGDTRAGRRHGALNKRTVEVRDWARSILEDEAVRNRTLLQARAGKLPPAIFNELLHYAYGKPKDTVDIQGGLDIGLIRRVVIHADRDDGNA